MARKRKKGRGDNGLPWLWKCRLQFYVTDPDTGHKRALRDKNGQIVCWDESLTEGENQKRANQIWFDHQSVRRAGLNGDENEVRVVLDQYLQKHVEKNASAVTFERYKDWFKSFVVGGVGRLLKGTKRVITSLQHCGHRVFYILGLATCGATEHPLRSACRVSGHEAKHAQVRRLWGRRTRAISLP